MDLKAFAAGEFPATDKGFGGITQRDFSKPLIAAANGSALAGGFEILISCDMVVAADHAKFGIPEASRGLVAGAGGLIRLPKRIPLAVAYEMALTAEPIDAQRAYELGLVNRVVPGEQVLDEAIALAERIAKNAPLAVRVSKDVMKKSLRALRRGVLDAQHRGLRNDRAQCRRDRGRDRLRREARSRTGRASSPRRTLSAGGRRARRSRPRPRRPRGTVPSPVTPPARPRVRRVGGRSRRASSRRRPGRPRGRSAARSGSAR